MNKKYHRLKSSPCGYGSSPSDDFIVEEQQDANASQSQYCWDAATWDGVILCTNLKVLRGWEE
jgi:hypothetical protein